MKPYRLLLIFCSSIMLFGYKPEKESENTSGGKSADRSSANETKHGKSLLSEIGEEANPSDSPKFAMNRNAVTRELLTPPKPEGLTLLKPLSPSLRIGRTKESQVREVSGARIELSPDRNLGEIGTIKIPPSVSSARWREATISPDGSQVLMNPEDMAMAPSLYQVHDGALNDQMVEEVPNVNFDESRRWFIHWQGWLSDSKLYGVINEDDPAGHMTVRTGIYLYDVVSRELQRVDLPTGTTVGGDTFLEVIAVSDNVIVVNTSEGEKTLSWK